MKLTILLTCVLSVHSLAGALAQKVTIQANNKSLKSVIQQLQRQSGYSFVLDDTHLAKAEPITLSLTGVEILEALPHVFADQPFDYNVEGKVVYFLSKRVEKQASASQDIRQQSVAGKITDEQGTPLEGVTVRLKGTGVATTTDNEGRYEIHVPDNASTLTFSIVGFDPVELTVASRSTIDVSLKATVNDLDEVIVVGYGTQSRRLVTGSVAKVDVAALSNFPNTNISQALRGRVAGVQFQDNGRPGQNGSILIRGRSSITASNNPLIVVDGVFFNGSFADINPNDVASMEVLKDATASAIYGSRAANGVIIITTKFGESGKPTISTNSYTGVSTWGKTLTLLSQERYVEKTLDYRRITGQEATPDKIADYLQPIEAENYLNGRVIDPWDEISQTANIQSVDLNISGASERTKYYLSAAYTQEKGLVYGDKAIRGSFRSNIDTRITDWLNVGVNAQFTRRDLSGVEANLSDAYYLTPYSQLYLDGDRSQPLRSPSGETLLGNPMFPALLYKDAEFYNNLYANFFGVVDFPFLEGLSFRVNVSPNLRSTKANTFRPNYTENDYNIISSASKATNESIDYVLENILKYERAFDNKHGIDFTLMYGRNKRTFESTSANATDFFSDATFWDDLSLAETQRVSSDAWKQGLISQMGRLNYTFQKKYLLTATVRRDGASVFSANNKWGVFPSIALGWILSDEQFLKGTEWVDFLKIRASYGKLGNQAINHYSTFARLGTFQYVYGDGSPSYIGVSPTSMGNSSLKWETTFSTNLAVDFGVLKDRINGTVEYYKSRTRDLLLSRAIPNMNGFPRVVQNLGATSNEGIEVTLRTANIRKANFRWDSDFVFSTNNNKITALYGRDLDADGMEDDDISNKWFIGKPVLVEFDYAVDGIYQEGDTDIPQGWAPGYTRIRDVNGDGAITPDDRTVLGQQDPKYLWSINNALSYRSFSFSVMINGQGGFLRVMNRINPTTAGGSNFPNLSMNMLDDGWWTPENKSNEKPSLIFTNPLNHGFYANRDFMRIQDVTLSYSLSHQLIDKLKLQHCKFYLSARNLATFTKWPGWDPETGDSERTAFPVARTFTFGLNFSL